LHDPKIPLRILLAAPVLCTVASIAHVEIARLLIFLVKGNPVLVVWDGQDQRVFLVENAAEGSSSSIWMNSRAAPVCNWTIVRGI
jgi:hypothetical protein